MSFLASMIPYLAPFVAGIVIREVALGAKWLVTKLRSNPKTAALAAGVAAAEDALDAGVQAAAANASKSPKEIAAASLDAVKASVTSDATKSNLLAGAQAELQALVQPGATTISDGEVTANMPLVGQELSNKGK